MPYAAGSGRRIARRLIMDSFRAGPAPPAPLQRGGSEVSTRGSGKADSLALQLFGLIPGA